jgi:hypothetical protein
MSRIRGYKLRKQLEDLLLFIATFKTEHPAVDNSVVDKKQERK